MKTTKKNVKPATAKPQEKRGNVTQAEITPLIMAARKAFDAQDRVGLVEFTGSDSKRFDAWRQEQCMSAVGKPGITSCNHDDFQPLLAHFQTLAGDNAAAFRSLMKSGKPTENANPGDTHEARRVVAKHIADALNGHINLASASIDAHVANARTEWEFEHQGIDYPGPDPMWLADLMTRKAAVDARGKGACNVGYLVWLVRQKTRRPDLQLGRDWQAGLAERCTVRQLTEIRSTIINRIAAVEGTGDRRSRNKSQRGQKAAADRSPHTVAHRPGTDPF